MTSDRASSRRPSGPRSSEAEADPRPPQDREAPDRRRRRTAARADHRQGHREAESSTRSRRRTSGAASASGGRSASGRTRSIALRRSSHADVDVLVVDTAHGHSRGVVEMVAPIKDAVRHRGDRGQHRHRRRGRGADRRRCRLPSRSARAGLDLHHARRRRRRRPAGDGDPTASDVAEGRHGVPVIADGGITSSGDRREGDRHRRRHHHARLDARGHRRVARRGSDRPGRALQGVPRRWARSAR